MCGRSVLAIYNYLPLNGIYCHYSWLWPHWSFNNFRDSFNSVPRCICDTVALKAIMNIIRLHKWWNEVFNGMCYKVCSIISQIQVPIDVYLPSVAHIASRMINSNRILQTMAMLLKMWCCQLSWHAPTVDGTYSTALYCGEQHRSNVIILPHISMYVIGWNTPVFFYLNNYLVISIDISYSSCSPVAISMLP